MSEEVFTCQQYVGVWNERVCGKPAEFAIFCGDIGEICPLCRVHAQPKYNVDSHGKYWKRYTLERALQIRAKERVQLRAIARQERREKREGVKR